MKKTTLLVALASLCFAANGQSFTEWQDPKINQINRLPMNSWFIASPTEQGLNNPELNSSLLSLNGIWRFSFAANANERLVDFYSTKVDDSTWDTMPVPGLWEVNGGKENRYGDPVYVNVGYAWRGHYKNNPPTVPEKDNRVGSYRRTFDIPAEWKGKDVILTIGSATSNVYVYVNGRFVGYSEDSKMACSFDLTKYLRYGEQNLIALQIFRWSDGTYLEDQDFWRLSGIGRDVFLTARPKARLNDIRIVTELDANYKDAVLKIETSTSAVAKKVAVKVVDPAGREVTNTSATPTKGSVKFDIPMSNPQKWSAETPALYTVTVAVSSNTSGTAVTEYVEQKAGFRTTEVKGAAFLVNGRQVLIKGADRHEMDPINGYCVSRERMIEDIMIMKQLNINAVRTCHYPDSPLWYDLCDQYGIYVVCEANVESHGMGYGAETLAKNPGFKQAHLERNSRMVECFKNHPSIVTWSLGNEAGFGSNFEACYRWIKDYDKTRPVQYEQGMNTDFSDIMCPMYRDYEGCIKYCESNPSKPLIQCEYAHAMGNSMGGFKDYWDIIRKYPAYQGGFIWDFVDQALTRYESDGKVTYLHGGDFNKYDPTDNSFNSNGIITANRTLHPHAYEVQKEYQSIWTQKADITMGKIKIYNENFFKDLSNVALEWELCLNGDVVETGRIDNLDVAPQESKPYDLGVETWPVEGNNDFYFNFRYLLKRAEPLLPAGWVVARDQIFLPEADQWSCFAQSNCTKKLSVDDKDANVKVVGENWEIVFSKQSGFIEAYNIKHNSLIEEGTELRPNFWRAPTENDLGAQLHKRYEQWRNPTLKLLSFDVTLSEGCATVKAAYDMPTVQAKLDMTYVIDSEGTADITEKMTATPDAKVSNLFRFGMTMTMPARYNVIDFYGRGPHENYIDRTSSSPVGKYCQTVAEQYHAEYVRPQESGTKSDLRYWTVRDGSGMGLTIVGEKRFSASALPYSIEQLDFSTPEGPKHSGELQAENKTFVNFDTAQLGLGCVTSWGHQPREQYRLPYGDYTFRFTIGQTKY